MSNYEVVVTSNSDPMERWVYADRADAQLTAQLRRTEWAREGSKYAIKVEVKEIEDE